MPFIQKIGEMSASENGINEKALSDKILSIELDEVVFKREDYFKNPIDKILVDTKLIVENAKKETSKHNSPEDVTPIIYYNTNIYSENDLKLITQRLDTKKEVDQKENENFIKKETRAISKHRAITLPVTADANCSGISLDEGEQYKYLLTVVNAPNAGNSKKGNGAPSSDEDMRNYFLQSDSKNYKLAMKEIYKTVLESQKNSEVVVIPPLGLGVYISNLNGRDLYILDGNKEDKQKFKDEFIYNTKNRTISYVSHDGEESMLIEKNKQELTQLEDFIRENDGFKTSVVHLNPTKCTDFGLDMFCKIPRTNRLTEQAINTANYEALREVLEEYGNAPSIDKSIKAVILTAMRNEGEAVFEDYIANHLSVFKSPGDMLQTVQSLNKSDFKVGLVCPGSDHDTGGAADEALEGNAPGFLPAEEQIALTSNFTASLRKAVDDGRLKFVPYQEPVADSVLENLSKIKLQNEIPNQENTSSFLTRIQNKMPTVDITRRNLAIGAASVLGLGVIGFFGYKLIQSETSVLPTLNNTPKP